MLSPLFVYHSKPELGTPLMNKSMNQVWGKKRIDYERKLKVTFVINFQSL